MNKKKILFSLIFCIGSVVVAPTAVASQFTVAQKNLTDSKNKKSNSASFVDNKIASNVVANELELTDSVKSLALHVGMDGSSSFLAQEPQSLPYMTHSMEHAVPITASVATQSPSVENNQQSSVAPVKDSSVERLETWIPGSYLTSAEFLQAQEPNNPDNDQEQTSPNASDRPPMPLPEDLDIDEAGGQFSLGVIRPIPVLELVFNSSVFTNQTLNTTAIVDATAFLNRAALRASPELGPDTRLTAGIGGVVAFFTTENRYTSINADLGILQELGDKMSLGLGWNYQQIYSEFDFDNDLSEHTARLSWNRTDQLERRLFLNSRYQLSASFAQDEEQSRLTNSAGIGLSYSFTPRLQGLLDYRLVYNTFFDNPDALRHQLGTQLNYQITRNFLIGGSISYVFGEGNNLLDDEVRDLNNVSLGLHLQYNLPLLY
jgi:hypothetical protein